MITESQKHIVITMVIIIIVATVGGILLFYFSDKAAKKKEAEIKLTHPQQNEKALRYFSVLTHV